MSVWDPRQTLENIGIDPASRKEERQRSVRVARAIEQEVAVLLVEKIADPRLQPAAVTRVEVTGDLGLAKIFYTVTGGNKARAEADRGFKRAAGFIRTHIAKTINLRFTPALQFHYDTTAEKVAELDGIFDEIAKERDRHGADSSPGN